MPDTLRGILICIPIVAGIFLVPLVGYKIWKLVSKKRLDPERVALQEKITAEAWVITGIGRKETVLLALAGEKYPELKRETNGETDTLRYSHNAGGETISASDGFTASVQISEGQDGKVTALVSIDRWNEKDGLSPKRAQELMNAFLE